MQNRLLPFALLAGASLPILLLAACGGAEPTATPQPTPTATPSPAPSPTPVPARTFNVLVGEEDKSEGLSIEAFLPKDFTILVGDTVVFNKKTAEPHTVTFNVPSPAPEDFIPHADGRLEANPVVFFPNPPQPPAEPGASVDYKFGFDGAGYLNSGFLQGQDDKVSVTFQKAGQYPYLCKLHPAMKGTIIVEPNTVARTVSQDDLDDMAENELKALKDLSKTVLDAHKPPPAAGKTHTVLAGAGDGDRGIDYYRFIGGENLTVSNGDTVTFTMKNNVPGTPHTITFLSGEAMPELITVEPNPQGPPRLFINPAILPPAPMPPTGNYDGTGFTNSGFLIAGVPDVPQEFSLTFTKAGTYKYLCLLHDPSGMNGTITVR